MTNEHHEQENVQIKQEELKKQLEVCLAAQHEWKDKFMRATADFENYKRRAVREQTAWIETCQQKIFLDLLPIVDDFDRALQQASGADQSVKSVLDGFLLIRASLIKLLHSFGIEKMSNYTLFDPVYHEAVAQVAHAEKKSGMIVEVLQQGYVWKDKVLRPAKVTVAQ